LVGRDYKRKGIPIAIDVTKQLNENGIPTELTICGLTGDPDGPVRFAGLFRKSIPEELKQYADLYRQAHLLIHPALFEAAGIVPAEAAAFGVPTITNDVGGLATSVAHDISGIVLPGHSPAPAYVEAITGLFRNPEGYRRLSVGARHRYESEQNWEVAGKRVMKILEEVVAEHTKNLKTESRKQKAEGKSRQ
jgi:glycosyltransferase involved in cell wall biosynthesis